MGGLVFYLLCALLYYHRGGEDSTESRTNDSYKGNRLVKGINWQQRRESVRDVFVESWDGYKKYAWGKDIYHPLSMAGEQMYGSDKGIGWIIVDALDTLMIMNLTSRLADARSWVSTSLDFDQDIEVSTFETTIRMLGGLLSAHYLSSEYTSPQSDDHDLYLEKATDLADRLMGAFDSSSGVPFASVNLHTMQGIVSHADGGASSTAEATSLQLEFKYMSYLTGETNYWRRAEKVMQVVDDANMEASLVPIFISAVTGSFMGSNIRLGSRGDSYYEYLIKQYLQTEKEESIYERMWNESLAGVRKHLVTYSDQGHLTLIGELPTGIDGIVAPKMDHLVCFMPGTIALAVTGGQTINETKLAGRWNAEAESQMRLARELTKTCWGMYKVMVTGLAPEIAFFNLSDPPHMESAGPLESAPLSDDPSAPWRHDYIINHNDNHNLQRPETVETLFYMWRITGDEIYRHWGWEMFQKFVQYTRADGDAGYTSLDHANEIPPILRDNMESFWLVSLSSSKFR